MSAKVASLIGSRISAQPDDVRLLSEEERDRIIITAIQVDGAWIIKSQYGDDIWELTGGPTNRNASHKQLDFNKVPKPFRAVFKEVMYRYIRRGLEGAIKPTTSTIFRMFTDLLPFLRHLSNLKLKHIDAVTPLVCSVYVAACKDVRQSRRKGNPLLSPATLEKRFSAVEMLYELSQFTSTPVPMHPWPESSAKHLAGRTGIKHFSKTPLIPDDVFTTLFLSAWAIVQGGDALLKLRDGLDEVTSSLKERSKGKLKTERFQDILKVAKNRYLAKHRWKGGLRVFTAALNELRTACYIVVASLSGCRNHELAYVQTGACYRSEDDKGEIYWWMRSQSVKTGAGNTEWMIPEAAVEALRIMDRWAGPLQTKLADEIAQRRSANPKDPEIAEAQMHLGAVFLAIDKNQDYRVRTLSNHAWNGSLKRFAKHHGLDWDLATHQFRRKFANYAARSQFGDLRYLREHFKHWTQDMTNDGYALNRSHITGSRQAGSWHDIFDMARISTAELERRLERARTHREEELAFFRCLLDAWVYAHVPLSDDHPRLRLIQFQHPDGFYAVPFFTSEAKARFAGRGVVRIVKFTGRELLAGTPGATFMLNPNDSGCVLYPEEVEALLRTGTVARLEGVHLDDDYPFLISDQAKPTQHGIATMIHRELANPGDRAQLVKQVIVLTHNLFFFHELVRQHSTNLESAHRRCGLLRVVKNQYSEVAELNPTLLMNDYDVWWHLLKDALAGKVPTQVVPNAMRNILEQFFTFTTGTTKFPEAIKKLANEDTSSKYYALERFMDRGSHRDGINGPPIDWIQYDVPYLLGKFRAMFAALGQEQHYLMKMGSDTEAAT